MMRRDFLEAQPVRPAQGWPCGSGCSSSAWYPSSTWSTASPPCWTSPLLAATQSSFRRLRRAQSGRRLQATAQRVDRQHAAAQLHWPAGGAWAAAAADLRCRRVSDPRAAPRPLPEVRIRHSRVGPAAPGTCAGGGRGLRTTIDCMVQALRPSGRPSRGARQAGRRAGERRVVVVRPSCMPVAEQMGHWQAFVRTTRALLDQLQDGDGADAAAAAAAYCRRAARARALLRALGAVGGGGGRVLGGARAALDAAGGAPECRSASRLPPAGGVDPPQQAHKTGSRHHRALLQALCCLNVPHVSSGGSGAGSGAGGRT